MADDSIGDRLASFRETALNDLLQLELKAREQNEHRVSDLAAIIETLLTREGPDNFHEITKLKALHDELVLLSDNTTDFKELIHNCNQSLFNFIAFAECDLVRDAAVEASLTFDQELRKYSYLRYQIDDLHKDEDFVSFSGAVYPFLETSDIRGALDSDKFDDKLAESASEFTLGALELEKAAGIYFEHREFVEASEKARHAIEAYLRFDPAVNAVFEKLVRTGILKTEVEAEKPMRRGAFALRLLLRLKRQGKLTANSERLIFDSDDNSSLYARHMNSLIELLETSSFDNELASAAAKFVIDASEENGRTKPRFVDAVMAVEQLVQTDTNVLKEFDRLMDDYRPITFEPVSLEADRAGSERGGTETILQAIVENPPANAVIRNGKIDLEPAKADKASDPTDSELGMLPALLKAAAEQIGSALSHNFGAAKTALSHYSDHITGDAEYILLELLKQSYDVARAGIELAVDEGELGPDTKVAWKNFKENHDRFLRHFPYDPEREEQLSELELAEDANPAELVKASHDLKGFADENPELIGESLKIYLDMNAQIADEIAHRRDDGEFARQVGSFYAVLRDIEAKLSELPAKAKTYAANVEKFAEERSGLMALIGLAISILFGLLAL